MRGMKNQANNKTKIRDSVVKIDSVLLKEIEDFINKPENRLKFVNKKQFIDLAVYDFLSKIKHETKRKEGVK